VGSVPLAVPPRSGLSPDEQCHAGGGDPNGAGTLQTANHDVSSTLDITVRAGRERLIAERAASFRPVGILSHWR